MASDPPRNLMAQMMTVAPHATAIGLTFEQSEDGRGLMSVPWREDLVADPESEVIASGIVTTLLDHTCGLAVNSMFEIPFPIATLDLRIDYMRPAAARAGIKASADCYKITRSIAFVRAQAWDVDPSDPVATAQAAFILNRGAGPVTAESALAEFLARSPYIRFLGMTAELDGDSVLAKLPFDRKLIGNPTLPALHGGVLGAFQEMTALAQLAVAEPSRRMPKTIDVTIEYLRPGKPLDLYARADLRKVGRRIANVHVECWQESPQHPVAALRGHFLLRQD